MCLIIDFYSCSRRLRVLLDLQVSFFLVALSNKLWLFSLLWLFFNIIKEINYRIWTFFYLLKKLLLGLRFFWQLLFNLLRSVPFDLMKINKTYISFLFKKKDPAADLYKGNVLTRISNKLTNTIGICFTYEYLTELINGSKKK